MKKYQTNPQNLIGKLVKERTTAPQQPGDRTSPRFREKQREWNKLKTEPVYLLSLTVKVGVQSLKLSGMHLGINEQVIRLLEDAAKGGYRASTSQRLKDAAHKLQARQKIIYNQYTVLSEPFRLVHETSLPSALQAIEAMQQEALQLRQEIVTAYEEEFTAFLSWAHNVLRQANLETAALEAALTHYADHYPTQADFQQCLQVVVEGPIKIPSLIEDAQVQVVQAQEQAAATAIKLEQDKLAIVRRSQEALSQTLIAAMYDAQTRSRDEAYGKLAELLESFAISGEDATSRTGQKWATLQDRLYTLAQFDPTLSAIVQQTALLEQLLLSEKPDLQDVQALMDDFRAILKDQIKKESAGAGIAQLTKALQFDTEYGDLLKQLDAITDAPSPEEFHKLKGKLAAMEGILRIRSKSLKEKWEQAENAVRKFRGVAKVPETQLARSAMKDGDEEEVEHLRKGRKKPKTLEPYDPDAGF